MSDGMDRIESAVRRYKQLLPDAVEHISGSKLRQLQVWLAEDVCLAIEPYIARPRFRDHAAWPVRSLRREAQTLERQQIEVVDAAIVRCARALSGLAAKASIKTALRSLPANSLPEIPRNTQSGALSESITYSGVYDLDKKCEQIAQLARRPWKDLVQIEDYFEPQQEFVDVEPGELVQRGEFIVTFNPELRSLGNFVVRCLLRRLDIIIDGLAEFRLQILLAQRKLTRQFSGSVELQTAWEDLQKAKLALVTSCQAGHQAGLRDSCIIATQVYGAFHSAPDLGWLGLSTPITEHGLNCLRARATQRRNGEMFERIVGAIGDLKRLYENAPPVDSAFDEAVATGGLVIDVGRRKVFWETRDITDDLNRFRIRWKLLLALATKAAYMGHVTEDDVDDRRGKALTFMSSNVDRLRKMLPASLKKLIIPGSDPRSYRLTLEAQRIHVIK